MKDTADVLGPAYCYKEPLTIEEAVLYTGISRGSLYQLIHRKQIPHYKPLVKKVYFKRSDLDAFLFRNRRAADYEVSDAADAILTDKRRY